MIDTVNILMGSTFVTSDRRGDIAGTPVTPHGLFAFDTRFLSLWRMTVDGQVPAVLSTDEQRYYIAQFFLAPSTGTTYIDSPLSIVRRRWIENVMWEQIGIFNHTPEARNLHVHIDLDADFADLFEVKDALQKKGSLYNHVEDNTITLGYVREDYRRETRIRVEAENAQITPKAIDFQVALPGHGSWRAEFRIEPIAAGNAAAAEPQPGSLERLDRAAKHFHESAPTLRSDWRPLERAYSKSIEDLGALRFQLPSFPDAMIPAAGLPWFMSLFGRDSVITSYQALPFVPDLALATLRTLAGLQGTRIDKFRDEEPGKIPHELRFGEMTAFEERPHSPYYGSADSTALWLILLDEYERWTGREDVIRELRGAAHAALEWLDRYGDRDGDGFIEYERGVEETGLDNQCWKDSWDSIRFSDGRMAHLPRATCELQGYAYDAKMRSARLARDIWAEPDLADALEASAAELKRRFNEKFWLEDRGYFALALDGDKQRVDSLTSNIGHLLWSGIVDADKAEMCVKHLMGERMFSGWGIRTMADGEGAYNPIGYHVGTVWPHDNSIIAMGLCRYGYREEAALLAQSMIEASNFFHARLPEAFAGYPRESTHFPAEYPTACSPQAWATGTPLLMIRAILGMEPQGAQLRVDPYLPQMIGELDLSEIPGRWGRTKASADAADTLVGALESVAKEAPPAVRELFATLDRANLPAAKAGSAVHASVGFRVEDEGDWLVAVDEGRIRVREGFDTADCVLEMSEPTLLAILRGEQNARTALLSGKVKVTGDFEIASKLSRIVARSTD
jgi:glycogen debranching enzyme/putative sterol carrier protein